MGVQNLFTRVTAGSDRRHYECRLCGTNLTSDAEQCPNCPGDVIVYEL